MNRNEELEKLKEEYQSITAPQEGIVKMESAIRRARMDKERAKRNKRIRNWGIGAAAALVFAALPNTNESIAYAMGNLPVIGGLFKVVTVREYTHDDGHNIADVKVPQVVLDETETSENSTAAEQVNRSVDDFTNELVSEFNDDMRKEGYKGLDVSYETVMDTKDWFTLKITALQIEASGYEIHRFYHIDKSSGKVAELKDLFTEGADYISPISGEIKKQMKQQIEAGTGDYFMEGDEYAEGFKAIQENQNFYLNENGSIVIVFDEYEVGPGYIGSPEFVIPADVVSGIRK